MELLEPSQAVHTLPLLRLPSANIQGQRQVLNPDLSDSRAQLGKSC